jgi:hypothetical protein
MIYYFPTMKRPTGSLFQIGHVGSQDEEYKTAGKHSGKAIGQRQIFVRPAAFGFDFDHCLVFSLQRV